jgi:serine/alanine adding enzyme
MADWHLMILANKGADCAVWRQAVERLPEEMKDVHFLPEFSLVLEGFTNEQMFLVKFGDEDNYVLNVFARREISNLPFIKPADARYADIVTPYGYGGPVLRCKDPKISKDLFDCYLRAFGDYCLSNGIVAEFSRLHPLIGNHCHFKDVSGLIKKSSTVWMNLAEEPDVILSNMRRDQRYSIRKAIENGVTIERSDRKEDLEDFYRLYTSTMEKHNALDSYMFPLDFFEDTVRYLDGHVSLFIAKWDGMIIGASLFVHYGYYIHYHLSGMNDDFRKLRAIPLLLYQVALWGRQRGFACLHLGGGHGCEEDSLYDFKRGFSKNESDFHVYRQVHNPVEYERICSLKSAFEGDCDISDTSLDPVLVDYFPAYRG